MTALDWAIVAFAAGFAIVGAGRGLMAGLLSLGGLALGAFAGARVGPLLLARGSDSPYAPLFALGGAALAGALLAGSLGGIGDGLRARLRRRPARALDAGMGALLMGAVAAGLVWIAGAVALQAPELRDVRGDLQRSAVLRALNGVLPPSGPVLRALARADPLGRVAGPSARVPAPDRAVLRDPEVRAAVGSVVRILGTACGLGVEGSGWIAGGGLVVTNAHVVAGQDDTVVEAAGRPPGLTAQAVAFDPGNDVAVLLVPELTGRALELADVARPGAGGAILGFPQNGPFDARAARVGETLTAVTTDAYGAGPVTRRVTTLRGRVRPGNSGGPVVGADGRVLTTVFAARTSGDPGGFGVPNAVVREALRGARAPVSTGPCATG